MGWEEGKVGGGSWVSVPLIPMRRRREGKKEKGKCRGKSPENKIDGIPCKSS